MSLSPIDIPPPPEQLVPRTPLPAPEESVFALLWRDHALQILIALALVVNLALFGYLAIRFESLPDNLPLHFDVSGLPDRIDVKSGIFGLPIIGLVVFILNTGLGTITHRLQRAATLLLAVSALLVQILLWFAAINIIGGLV